MMNLQGLTHGTVSGYPIPGAEFNAALAELNFQSANWYRANYGEACRICIESEASRRLLLSLLNHQTELRRSGQDFSVPLVILAATMLQIGYGMGRKHAEAEILEGWMKL